MNKIIKRIEWTYKQQYGTVIITDANKSTLINCKWCTYMFFTTKMANRQEIFCKTVWLSLGVISVLPKNCCDETENTQEKDNSLMQHL